MMVIYWLALYKTVPLVIVLCLLAAVGVFDK